MSDLLVRPDYAADSRMIAARLATASERVLPASAEVSLCPCLAFDGPAGCPACGGCGVVAAADAQRFLRGRRVTCPWCSGGWTRRHDDATRRVRCAACLGSGRMPVRGLDLDRMKWMRVRAAFPYIHSFAIAVAGEDLTLADLSGLRFPAMSFLSCRFDRVTFAGASLGQVYFAHCDFTGSRLDLADVGDAVFMLSAFRPGTAATLRARGALVLRGEPGEPPPGTDRCAACAGRGCPACDDRGWRPEEEIGRWPDT